MITIFKDKKDIPQDLEYVELNLSLIHILELSKNGPDADKTADKAGDDLPDSQKRNCAVRGLPDFYP